MIDRIIRNPYTKPSANTKAASSFISSFTDTFNQGAGLYISKETRQALHTFRDYLRREIAECEPSSEFVVLAPEQVEKFKQLRKDARIALRCEHGSADLRTAREEFTRDEEDETPCKALSDFAEILTR